MYKEKRRGDRGHPCLTPLVGCTRALFSPSIKMYSSFSYICLITLSKVDGIALRRRCDQSCCLGTVSYACEKSMKATCNLGLFLGYSFFAACLRCLRINRGCRVLLPGKKPNCVSGILPFFTVRTVQQNVFLILNSVPGRSHLKQILSS